MVLNKDRTYFDTSRISFRILPELQVMYIKEFKSFTISGGWLNFYWAINFKTR